MSRAQNAIAGETPVAEITFRRNPLIDALVLALLFIVWIFLIFPAVWIFVGSFKTNETMFAATTFSFTLTNYQTIFRAGFGRFIFNSLFICLVAVVISTFVSVIVRRSLLTAGEPSYWLVRNARVCLPASPGNRVDGDRRRWFVRMRGAGGFARSAGPGRIAKRRPRPARPQRLHRRHLY